jgi:hypothetical protein
MRTPTFIEVFEELAELLASFFLAEDNVVVVQVGKHNTPLFVLELLIRNHVEHLSVVEVEDRGIECYFVSYVLYRNHVLIVDKFWLFP